MPRPPKYASPDAIAQAKRDKSNRRYAKHQDAIRKRRQATYKLAKETRIKQRRIGGSNARELVAVTMTCVPEPSPPPMPDPVIQLGVRAKSIMHDFLTFIIEDDVVDFIKSLMHDYFCDKAVQGRIEVFTTPLDRLYDFRTDYEKVLGKVLQVEGCTLRRAAMEKAGEPIWEAVRYLEEIWCIVIEGPGHLRTTYNRKRLAWQCV